MLGNYDIYGPHTRLKFNVLYLKNGQLTPALFWDIFGVLFLHHFFRILGPGAKPFVGSLLLRTFWHS